MLSELPLVTEAARLDAGWLTAALGPRSGGEVVSVSPEVIGDGKIGSNLRLSLAWSPTGAGPESVVAKLPSSDPTSRATGIALGIYVRETRFYRELARSAGARTPHCHVGLYDEATGEFVLVLEDLAPAVVGDQLTGCSPAEAAAALDELALLHASHWGREPDELAPASLPGRAAEIQPFYCGLLDAFADRYAVRLEPEVLGVVRRFGEVMDAWGTASGDGPTALLHGDFRLDNLLFSDGRVAVVDWQMVATGPPMSDTAYFLGAGLMPADRRAHEADLVGRYHGRLTAAAPEAAAWSLHDCWQAYRLQSLGGLIMAVTASMMVGQGARSDEMFATMAERHARHALDCDAFGAIAAMAH